MILFYTINEHLAIQTKNNSNHGKSKPRITPGILIAIHKKSCLEKKHDRIQNDS